MSRRESEADSIYGKFLNAPLRNKSVLTERMYLRVLTELATNRFKWTGLPDTVDERFLELTLFYRALSVFFYDEATDRYMAWRGTGAGPINMYDNYNQFTVIGNTAGSRTLYASSHDNKGPECVPIFANVLRVPDHDIVRLYAARLAQIDTTIDVNIKAQRHSHVLTVPENERLTYVNLMRQQTEGEPYLFGMPGLDMSNVQAFDIGVDPEAVLKLQIAKTKLWGECMTLLGINNANQDKKERLVADEVAANDDQVMAARGVGLNSRKRAAAEINRIWGLSIGVGWNEQAEAVANGMPEVG